MPLPLSSRFFLWPRSFFFFSFLPGAICHCNSSSMLSGFARDDPWSPSSLDLTVLRGRGSHDGCSQRPDSSQFPAELKPEIESRSAVFCVGWGGGWGRVVCVHVQRAGEAACSGRQGQMALSVPEQHGPTPGARPQHRCARTHRSCPRPPGLSFPARWRPSHIAFLPTGRIAGLSALPAHAFPRPDPGGSWRGTSNRNFMKSSPQSLVL